MSTSVVVRALPAYAPSPGLIGTVFGKPALAQETLTDVTLANISAAVARVTALASATGNGYNVIVSIYGRKPRGYDAMRQSWSSCGNLGAHSSTAEVLAAQGVQT